MPALEDYYKVLEVDPDANAEEIRRAYIKKARDYHPDTLHDMPDNVAQWAEEKMKEVNRAYEVLRSPERRKDFDSSHSSRGIAPRPEIGAAYVKFFNVEPGQRYNGYFVIRNSGGAYKKLNISSPDSWVKITGQQPLHKGTELPLRVEFQVRAQDWDELRYESITVSLDDKETYVNIELHARPKQSTKKADFSKEERQNYSQTLPGISKSRELAAFTRLGRMIGGVCGAGVGVGFTIVMASEGASAFAKWPNVGATIGILGGIYMSIVLVPACLLVGLILGWISGSIAWTLRNAIRSVQSFR